MQHRAWSGWCGLAGIMLLAGCGSLDGESHTLSLHVVDDEEPDAGSCADVLVHPEDYSNLEIFECGLAQELGVCVATGSCETCACANYVKLTNACDASGLCPDAPLSGTGCSEHGYYAGEHHGTVWDCGDGDSADVAGCMIRRLITWGYCEDAPPPPPPPPSECDAVLEDPYGASDDAVVECGLAQELGKCVATGSCPTCACSYYVKVTDQCDESGLCPGAPLSGTGCADYGYYAGEHEGTVWNCDQEDPRAVTACMLRRLIEWEQCVDPAS